MRSTTRTYYYYYYYHYYYYYYYYYYLCGWCYACALSVRFYIARAAGQTFDSQEQGL